MSLGLVDTVVERVTQKLGSHHLTIARKIIATEKCQTYLAPLDPDFATFTCERGSVDDALQIGATFGVVLSPRVCFHCPPSFGPIGAVGRIAMEAARHFLRFGPCIVGLCLVSVMYSGQPLAATEPTPTPTLTLGYDVYLGGLNIFSFEAGFKRKGARYTISGAGKTKGIVRLVWRWAVKTTSTGMLKGGRVVSHSYDVATLRKKKHKLMQLVFKGRGAYAITRTPTDSPRKRKKRKLPKSIPTGALDPVSIVLAVGGALERGASCGGKFPVFDGNRRYDLIFEKEGEEHLSKPGFSTFSGPTTRCRFTMKRVSGFRKKRFAIRFWDEEKHEQPQIWMGRLDKDLPLVLIQFQAEFNLGYMIVYLRTANYGDRVLLAPRPKKLK
jgi:hypothetical protein